MQTAAFGLQKKAAVKMKGRFMSISLILKTYQALFC
jgi:hypothetical protein